MARTGGAAPTPETRAERGATALAPPRRTLLWFSSSQAALVRKVVELASLDVVGWGVSDAGGAGVGLAREAFAGEPLDDARRALMTVEADVALIATASAGAGPSPLDDPALLRSCAEKGMKIASLEPGPGTTQAQAAMERAPASATTDGAPPPPLAPIEPVRFVPAMRRSKGFRAAAEAIERVGPARTLAIAMRGGHGQGSLAARLFDAMDLVLAILGEPESIDAANAGPASLAGVHLAPGERLRDLRGDITANLRFGSGRAASLTLSDSAGRWFRGVMLLGQNGALRLDDKSFELIDAAGQTVDRSRSRISSGAPDDPGAAEAIAEQVQMLLDPRAPRTAPTPALTVLAMCEAALLSARTGQPESPATILRMAGVV